jgi:hypothetical protein
MATKRSKFGVTVEYMGDQTARTGSVNSFNPDNTTFVKFWT